MTSRVSNYIADVVMWLKFENSNISIRKVIITSILPGFFEQVFLRGGFGSSLIICDWY